jgi:hypothetical protein
VRHFRRSSHCNERTYARYNSSRGRPPRRPPAAGQNLAQPPDQSSARQSGGGGIRTHEPPCDGQRFSRPVQSRAFRHIERFQRSGCQSGCQRTGSRDGSGFPQTVTLGRGCGFRPAVMPAITPEPRLDGLKVMYGESKRRKKFARHPGFIDRDGRPGALFAGSTGHELIFRSRSRSGRDRSAVFIVAPLVFP